MVLSDISIKRPVLATVMSALIVVIGLAALTRLRTDVLRDEALPFAVIDDLTRETCEIAKAIATPAPTATNAYG